jgi:hydrogenase-4 component E
MSQFLIILAGTTMLYVFATTRIEGYIRAIAFQGLILALLVIIDVRAHSLPEFIFLLVETLVFKTVVIPLLLINIVRKAGLKREVEPYIPQFYSLLIASIVLGLGFVVAFWVSGSIETREPLYFGISIAIVVMNLILIVTRKKIVTHILGYIMMENGIFLLALSIANTMPFVINLGVFLDAFVAIFMFMMFLGRIQNAYDEDHIDALRNLKD